MKILLRSLIVLAISIAMGAASYFIVQGTAGATAPTTGAAFAAHAGGPGSRAVRDASMDGAPRAAQPAAPGTSPQAIRRGGDRGAPGGGWSTLLPVLIKFLAVAALSALLSFGLRKLAALKRA